MWDRSRQFLIVASVALNVTFVGVWFVYAIAASRDHADSVASPAAKGRIWCPLHEQLHVDDEQWNRIEPRLRQFRESAQAVCQEVGSRRLELLELIALPTPDREAIAAKQEEIQAGQQKMQGLVIEQLLAEKEALTAEQEEQLFAMLRNHCGGSMTASGPARGGIGQMLRDGSPSE